MGRGSLAYRVCSKKIVFCIFLILIVVSSTVLVQPSQAAELQRIRVDARRNRLPGEIGIFYDSGDAVLSQISTDLVSALRIANVSSSLFEVSSFAQLELLLSRSGVWVAVYVFNSGLGNVSLGREVVDWEDFAGFLLRHDRVHHILGIGNTRRLVDLVGASHANIHVADTDLVDAKLVFLYSFWAVADVLESMPSYSHKEVELDIRRVGLQFFADNFNDLFERTVKPKVPLGEEDVARKIKEFEEIRKRFPTSSHELPLIPPDGLTPDEMVKNGTSNEQEVTSDESSLPPPRLYLTRMPGTSTVVNDAGVRQSLSGVNAGGGSDGGSASESLYEVLGLPTKSGLDGPVGTILDYVLKVLIEVGGYTSAALDKGTVEKIVDAVKAIKTLIGVVKDAQGGSPLKSLFDILKSEFPALAGYEKYFDLFVDALFAFRGSLQDIVDWVKKALSLLLDELGLDESKEAIKAILNEMLSLGEEFSQEIKKSASVYDALLSWFVERITPRIIESFLKEAYTKLTGSYVDNLVKIQDALSKLTSILNAVVRFVVTGSSSSLMDKLMAALFDAFSLYGDLGLAGFNRITGLIKFVCAVLGYSDPQIDSSKLAALPLSAISKWALSRGGWPLWMVDSSGKKIATGTIIDVVSSPRGNTMDPGFKTTSFHGGVDIEAPKETPVFSVGDGVVSEIIIDGPLYDHAVQVSEKIDGQVTGQLLEYGHIDVSQSLHKGDEVNTFTQLGKLAPHPTITEFYHLHFSSKVGLQYVNPLRPGGPLWYVDTPGKPKVDPQGIFLFQDDNDTTKGEIDQVTSRIFVTGKVDIVARAYDPTGIFHSGKPYDAGVMQLMWKVDEGTIKYLIKDGEWDKGIPFSPFLFKEEAPADTVDASIQSYYYIITNTKDPNASGPSDIGKEGYWNTMLKTGQNEKWNGTSASTNAEAQYPDGKHVIWIRAGSDIGLDVGDWTSYEVWINNFEQTILTTDASGNTKSGFTTNDSIYIYGEGYKANSPYDVYAFPTGIVWNEGAKIDPGISKRSTRVVSDASGHIKGLLWANAPSGTYDIVVDYDNDAVYSKPRFGKSVDALCPNVQVTAAGGQSTEKLSSSALTNPDQNNESTWLDTNAESSFEYTTTASLLSTSTIDVEAAAETLEEPFAEWADLVMSYIKDAVEQGKTDVDAFQDDVRRELNNAIAQADLQVSDSTRQAIVDAVTLVAGVMNSKFDKTRLPSLSSVAREMLLDLNLPDETKETVNVVIKSIFSIAAMIKDDSSLMQVLVGDPAEFEGQFASIAAVIGDAVDLVLKNSGLDSETIDKFTKIGQATFTLIKSWRENKIQGVIQTIVQGVGFTLSEYYGLDLQAYANILEIAFPNAMGVTNPASPEEAVRIAEQFLDDLKIEDTTIRATVTTVLNYTAEIRDIYTDGYRWILNKIIEWLSGKVQELADSLTGELNNILSQFSFFHVDGEFELPLGGFTSFGMKYDLAMDAGINIHTDELFKLVEKVVFEGYDMGVDTGVSSLEDAFKTLMTFVEITPVFKASLDITGFGSKDSRFMNMLLESLGLELTFEGGAHFVAELFSFKAGAFEPSGFLKVVEWGLWFRIEVSRDFTLLDFLTGGAGGGALETLADYIGLDSITITVWFGLTLEVIKRAASATGPEQGTFTLMIEIGVALSLGIDILIASIDIYGSIKVVFTFAQDLLNTATPLRILMDIVAEVKVTLGFLFWDWDINWGPSKLYSHDFSGKPEDQDPNKRADPLGVDSDGDGLSDEYENRTAGLRFDLSDTDGDSLSDKEETQTTKTDPTKSDTDGDGLNDYDEYYQYKTNPKLADTDYDGVNDYEEVVIYGTNPKLMDTDADGLDDYYEINHVWDISNVTTSVKEVYIGGKVYNDHTDPLNPDTDNDGLLDGEEGKFGIYYGDKELYNQSLAYEGKISQARYFNYGYTHPLDNDTDDDSYLQLWDGSSALVSGQKRYLRSMTDGEEVKGIWVTFYNSEEDEWERRPVRTNPCNPDTDGDTGIPGDWTPAQLTVDRFLMSDGYELSLNPPTDPTNGDSDHDGLLDGLEGVINPYPNSYHTNPNNPDTDGDGLGDLQEIKLGTDPRNPDTDHDSVLDGDEYHRFHTDPRLPDTDYDGLTDGEEVYFWHTNPHIRDSDGDRISDGQEVLKYDTDPLDEDTDNDEINDYDEIFNYRTDPFNPDTDGDGLRDGPEVFKRHTDPLNWDTDGDSIKYLNEYGNMTWPMSDGDEVNIYHTDPARTDTDNDGLSDSLELYLASGRIPHNVLEPIPLDATNNDTDGDGLLDGVELRMGNTTSIIYPYIAFMPYSFYGTSPVKSDSDNDGLTDFEEVNGTLPSPRSFQPGSIELGHAKFNYTGSRADMPDTDADGLLDGEEVFIYGTDPVRNDTDGDGLMDCYETLTGDSGRKARRSEIYYARLGVGGAEILGAPNASFSFVPLRQRAGQRIVFDASTSYDEDGTISSYFWNFSDGATSTTTIPITSYTYSSYGTYKVSLTVTDSDGKKTITEGTVVVRLGTDALNPDTDGDLLPDGYEVDPDRIAYVSSKYGFTLDSLQSDVNNNGILDGYEIDSDSDGLKDGEEIFIFETQRTWRKGSFMAGGFLNPDSDGDGLSDGVEVHDFQTDPLKSDTDKDGYSDGAEVAAGTDPLKPTSSTEYTDALNNLRKGTSIRILYPTNSTTSDRIVDVRVVNFTSIESMWYRYDSGVGWSANTTLSYNHAELQWTDTDIVWNEGSYHIQIFGKTPEGYELWDEQWFSIKTPKEEIPFVAGWQIKIISPTPSTIYDSRVDLYVLNSTDVVNMWFRSYTGSGWMGNYTLEYNSVTKQWENTTTVWPLDSYHLQVFAFTPEDKVIWDEQWFTVKTGWIEIMSPTNTTVLDTGVDVIVANSSSVEDVWIRYHNGQNWSDNRTMVYDSVASKWKHTEIVWPEATYHIQAFASTPDGHVLTDEEWFTVRIEKTPALYIVLGVVISGLAATLLTYGGLRSRRLKGPRSQEESKTGNEGERK